MTLDEYLNKSIIIEEYSELNLSIKGVSKTITQWRRERNLGWNTINRRLKKGKSIGQALGFEN